MTVTLMLSWLVSATLAPVLGYEWIRPTVIKQESYDNTFYRAFRKLLDAGKPGEKPCTFRLGGPTCLAGDVVGDYSFAAPLTEGDRLIFGDMAIYSTCKNNTFNGMPLPDIWVLHENGTTQPLARFGYHDFKYRLGSPR